MQNLASSGRTRVVALFAAAGLLASATAVLAKKKGCCRIKISIKPPIVQVVEGVRKGKIDPVAVVLGGSTGIVPSGADKAIASAVNAATPQQIKDAIRGGQRLADSTVKAIQDAGDATVKQVVRQAEFVTGVADTTAACLTNNKCGRKMDALKEDVDQLAGEELQWAGNRMVAMGKLTKGLHEEMKLLKGEMLDAFAQVQDATRQLSGGPGSLFDPAAKGLEAFDRVLGNPGLKAAYDQYVVGSVQAIQRIERETYRVATESGDDVAIGLGNVMIGTGTAAERLGYYLALSSAGFPEAELGPAPVLQQGEKSSLAAIVSPVALNAILDGLQGERFAIGKSAKRPADDKEYVEINDFEARFDPASRTIMVVAKDAKVRARVAGTVQGVKVGTLRLQLIPRMTTSRLDDGQYRVKLTLRPKALHLDVKSMPTRIDQALAYVLNDTALKDTLDVDVSILTPVPTAESTVLVEGGKTEVWIRRAAFVPKTVDFLMLADSLTLRSVGAFERIGDVKKQ